MPSPHTYLIPMKKGRTVLINSQDGWHVSAPPSLIFIPGAQCTCGETIPAKLKLLMFPLFLHISSHFMKPLRMTSHVVARGRVKDIHPFPLLNKGCRKRRKKSNKQKPISSGEDNRVVWSARVQKEMYNHSQMRPTSELSQQTRGSTDRIIMKANNPPLLYKKTSLTTSSLCYFHCVWVFWGAMKSCGPWIFIFDKSEWKWVCVCQRCLKLATKSPFKSTSCWAALGRPLPDSRNSLSFISHSLSHFTIFLSPYLSLSFSLHSDMPWSVGRCSCRVSWPGRGRIIRKQNKDGEGDGGVETSGRVKTPLQSNL